MFLNITSPTILRLDLPQDKINWISSSLEYVDKKVDYEIKRYKKNSRWWSFKLGPEKLEQILENLKKKRKKSLLFKDENGYYTYSGLAEKISKLVNEPVVNKIKYPERELVPWKRTPTIELRPYQKEAVNKLIEAKHGAVNHATGLGKTACLLFLVKHYGLKTVIVTPSNNICNQIYDLFLYHFGKQYVGKFVGTKKEYKKLFVIATGQSLYRVQKGTPEWEELSKTQVLCNDEAHGDGSESFSYNCLELFASSPYRFFVTATLFRTDGLDLFLDAITGPIVHKMTVEEGIKGGYLAKPLIRMIKTDSSLSKQYDDPNDNTRKHLLYNDKVNEIAGNLANSFVKDKKPTLILINELAQFSCILPYLKYETKLAYSGGDKGPVPKEYQNKDTNKLVQEFNEGKIPILIGTSAVATGTDFKSVEACIYLMAGKSKIKVMQAIGRITRLNTNPWTNIEKKTCFYIDFMVSNNNTVKNHALERLKIYKSISDDIKIIER